MAQQEFWTLAKSEQDDDKALLESLLYLAFESARVASLLLQPFCPSLTSKMLLMLDADSSKDITMQMGKTFRLNLDKKVHFKKIF